MNRTAPRVREILSWYGAENPGVLTNLARILNHGRLGGTGKLVILPVDQGFEHGPVRSFASNPHLRPSAAIRGDSSYRILCTVSRHNCNHGLRLPI